MSALPVILLICITFSVVQEFFTDAVRYLYIGAIVSWSAIFIDCFVGCSSKKKLTSKIALSFLNTAATVGTLIWYLDHADGYGAISFKSWLFVFTAFVYIVFYIDRVMNCASAKKGILLAVAFSVIYTVNVALADIITLYTSTNNDIANSGSDYHWPLDMAVRSGFSGHSKVYITAFTAILLAAAVILICRYTTVGTFIRKHTGWLNELIFDSVIDTDDDNYSLIGKSANMHLKANINSITITEDTTGKTTELVINNCCSLNMTGELIDVSFEVEEDFHHSE